MRAVRLDVAVEQIAHGLDQSMHVAHLADHHVGQDSPVEEPVRGLDLLDPIHRLAERRLL